MVDRQSFLIPTLHFLVASTILFASYSIKILEVDSAARARTRMSISILLQIERASTVLPVSGHLCPRGTRGVRGGCERGYRISIYATPIIFQIAPLSFTLRPSDSRAETRRALSLSLSRLLLLSLSSRLSLQPSRCSSCLVSSRLVWSSLVFASRAKFSLRLPQHKGSLATNEKRSYLRVLQKGVGQS